MKDEIYDYLRNFGFSDDNIRYFEKKNTEVFYVNLKDVKDNIDFLLDKELNREEVINIINNNPFMLTDEKNRRDYYDNIYTNILNLNKLQIRDLINSNSDIYTASPIELENIIKYLSNIYDMDKIKNIILSNSKIITLKLEEVKKLVKVM